MWFIHALLTTLFWGTADLFYKKGALADTKYPHLYTACTVGIVMGIIALYSLIFGGVDYDFKNIIVYLPVSAMYILSMTVGYYGLKYLELSISSPVQNSSGAIVSVLCFFILKQSLDIPSVSAIVLISAGVILLAVFDKKEQDSVVVTEKKYKSSVFALIFPLIYAVIDALGTFFDAFYLDDVASSPLIVVTEDNIESVANISYGLTFLIFSILILIYLSFIKKEKIQLFKDKNNIFASFFETLGQSLYVYAMSGNAIVAAPMIASYSIVSVVLSRIFLNEKLSLDKYFAVVLVIGGIIILGIMEVV